MGRAWAEHGQGMGRAWEGHGQGMGRAWAGHGQGIDRAWAGHGQGMGRAWAGVCPFSKIRKMCSKLRKNARLRGVMRGEVPFALGDFLCKCWV